jgi:general secretion pathway protein A
LPATNRPFVRLVFPQLTPAELLAYLAVELGGTADGQGLDRTLLEIQRLLRHYAERGQQPVIVIDEAHLIDDALVFQALRLLLNFQQPQSGLAFSLILSGQPELLPRLARMPQLDERITAKSLLRALSFEETVAYVSHRLAAGGVDRPVFDPAALQTLFELSGGIPRRINRLCDLGLLVGYADNSPRIAPEQLEAVHEDLCATAA